MNGEAIYSIHAEKSIPIPVVPSEAMKIHESYPMLFLYSVLYAYTNAVVLSYAGSASGRGRRRQ